MHQNNNPKKRIAANNGSYVFFFFFSLFPLILFLLVRFRGESVNHLPPSHTIPCILFCRKNLHVLFHCIHESSSGLPLFFLPNGSILGILCPVYPRSLLAPMSFSSSFSSFHCFFFFLFPLGVNSESTASLSHYPKHPLLPQKPACPPSQHP